MARMRRMVRILAKLAPPERPGQKLEQIPAVRTLAELEAMLGMHVVSTGPRHVGRCPDADSQCSAPAIPNSGVWPRDGSN